MNKYDLALERVHNLYLLQTKLITSLDSDLRDDELRKELKNDMKKFEELLNLVDWRFMGGIDVLESLRLLPSEVSLKLKAAPAKAKAKVASKPKLKAKVKKITATKRITKKPAKKLAKKAKKAKRK
jgi:hypothetical protein